MPARWLGIVLVAAIGFGCGRITGEDDGEDANGKSESVGTGSSGEVDAGGMGAPGDSGTAGEEGTAGTDWIDGKDGGSGTGDGSQEDGGEPVGNDGVSGAGGTGLADGGSGIGELSFVASASVEDDVAIVIPSEARAGDLAILIDSSSKPIETPVPVFPDGWNTISNVYSYSPGALDRLGGGVRTVISYKIVETGDAGRSVIGMADPPATKRKILLVFRASGWISSVIVGSLSEEGVPGDPASQYVTAKSGSAPLVVIASYRSTAAILVETFSPAEDGEVANSPNFLVRYKIFNSSPLNVSVDLGFGNTTFQSFYLEVF